MTVRQAGRLDDGLKDLALLAVGAAAGCSTCTDAWYWAPAGRRAVLEAEIRGSALWHDGEVFTRLERLVMLYAEAAVMSPPMALGGLAAELGGYLGETGLAELTAIVAGQTAHAGLD
ncbi:MAG TPA: hypothetical protein VMF87_30380 [Streptosporangiaceae bacterium]|nr:hypothetical protein [Streptosporangiaceae bacterium]